VVAAVAQMGKWELLEPGMVEGRSRHDAPEMRDRQFAAGTNVGN
jgi:hypothetical protein